MSSIKAIVRQAGEVRLHTFVAGFTGNNIANATHIIEREKLVLIDAQFLASDAKGFRAYADGLKKPIDRLYISHRHPDHWFGLSSAFTDVPVYALKETIGFLKQNGQASINDHKEKLGPEAPTALVIPQHVAVSGTKTIDEVEYEFREIANTEIDFILTIRLPGLRVSIPQDLLYSGSHLYLTKQMKHWVSVLEEMLQSEDDLFLPGHGFPADKVEVMRNIEYLLAAQDAYDHGLRDDAFKQFLIGRYPARLCPGIFDIYIPRLFDGASDY